MSLSVNNQTGTAGNAERDFPSLYSGVALFSLASFNPDLETIGSLCPYLGVSREPKHVWADQRSGERIASVTFIMSAAAPDGATLNIPARFDLADAPDKTLAGDRVKVIDEWGRTAWVTFAQYKDRAVPVYKDGPAHIGQNYRMCRRGEERLTRFLRCLLDVPGLERRDPLSPSGYSPIDHPDEALMRLDDVPALFSGDFSEIAEALGHKKDPAVKALAGVRMMRDGALRPCLLPTRFARASSSGYDQWARAVRDDLARRPDAARDLYLVGPLKAVGYTDATDALRSKSRRRRFDPRGPLAL